MHAAEEGLTPFLQALKPHLHKKKRENTGLDTEVVDSLTEVMSWV